MIANLFTRLQYRWFVAFGSLVALTIVVEWTIIHTSVFIQKADMVSLGITLDFVLGIPLAYYFMVIQQARISRATLVAVMLCSGLIAGAILPTAQHQYLGYWTQAMVLVEVGVLLLVAAKGRTIWRQFRVLQQVAPNFIRNLYVSLAPGIGNDRLTHILVSEASVLRYSVFGWLGGIEKTGNQRVYTTHRESGHIAIMIALILTGMIEVIGVHLLLARWYPIAAWFATLVSIYGLLFFVADVVALVKRPLLIDEGALCLRLGLRWNGTFSLASIAQITPITEAPAKNREVVNGCFLTTPNVLITFGEPMLVNGLYGIQRSVRHLALFIDDRDAFMHELPASKQTQY